MLVNVGHFEQFLNQMKYMSRSLMLILVKILCDSLQCYFELFSTTVGNKQPHAKLAITVT